jgi:spermidine synthase
MMAFLFFHNRPRKIEMIGLGGGSLPKFCYCMLPDSDITVIEINPDVIALRDQFLIPQDDDRFRVICGDGADHVKEMTSAPDILLIDGFDEFGQPPALCSAEFYDACYARLAQDGLIIVNLWKDHNYEEYALNIHCAFHGKTLAIPSETGSNQIVLAVKGAKLSLSRAQLDATCSLFPQHQANFLRSVGQRIVRQIERQKRR